MQIGVVARELDMPASTIRYYEKIGLIGRQARKGGRRDIGRDTLLILRFIQLAQAAGFTIAEIRSLLDSYSADPSPAGMWKPFAEAKRTEIRERIAKLALADDVLKALLSCRCDTLADCVRAADEQ